MKFNEHSSLKGQHAFLSASKYHWVNYDLEKLREAYANAAAAQRGTELHDFACQCIKLGVRLPRAKKTLNLYVNDAIGFRMSPEVVLFYSGNAFGTADAISFSRGELRIHDLKTGITPASMRQLEVYAALFCLEYREDPASLKTMELRIYQNDEVLVHNPEPEAIKAIMETIKLFDEEIERMSVDV